MLLATVDYTIVLVALIGAVPASIAAYASLKNARKLKTTNGRSIAEQVEDALQTTIANNWRLQALGEHFDAPMPAAAAAVEAKVLAQNDVQSRAERKAKNGG